MTMIKAKVDFSKKLRVWDGFGVNYVETCQTPDYAANPQDYGGFSTLSPEKRNEILDLIFSGDGLKPGVVKMFFDPFHQTEENRNKPAIGDIDQSLYDHRTSSRWTRYFAAEGQKRTRADGRELQIVTTLYGPPGWMTRQKFVRGRDLDPECKLELAKYYVSWVKYLREEEGLPVRYISLHNEGEDYVRWPEDGSSPNWEHGHDYNLYWPVEQVVEFIKLVRDVLDAQGMKEVGVSPGETTNWFRFAEWGYADAIADDAEALEKLGLITSHGFIGTWQRWFGDTRSTGIDLLREKKPGLHSWTTSISWSKMDVHYLNEFRHNIYAAKVNALIPWACIQWSSRWAKGDPNPGTAFRINGDGSYTVEPGYYYYKQLCRAGQPGMSVAGVACNDTELNFLAFSGNDTGNPDAFVVLNTSQEDKTVDIRITGCDADTYKVYRTSVSERYTSLGEFKSMEGIVTYTAPAGSATTFYTDRA